MVVVTSTMSIGDFSRATRLSAKALRYYHRVGLLEPHEIDPFSGYRFYDVEQLAQAQLIRHFRSLDMPVDLIVRVLAVGERERDQLIAEHLHDMEERLERTKDAVTALRGLLATDRPATAIARKVVGATPALVIRDRISATDLGAWFSAARLELDEAGRSTDVQVTGPLGGLWSTGLVLDEMGDVALFVPVEPNGSTAAGRGRFEILPPALLAVATHRGPDATIAQVYAELGEHVARHETGVDGPIRETYLAGVPGGEGVTEIGWPIAR